MNKNPLVEAYQAVFYKEPPANITEVELAEVAIEGLGEKHDPDLRFRCRRYIIDNPELPEHIREFAMMYIKVPTF